MARKDRTATKQTDRDERYLYQLAAKLADTEAVSANKRGAASDGNAFLVVQRQRVNIAIPFPAVREVMEEVVISPVPFVQPPVVGLASLHGRVSSVIDLASMLSKQRCDGERTVVAVDDPRCSFMLLVDAVLDIHSLKKAEQPRRRSERALPLLGEFVQNRSTSARILDLDELMNALGIKQDGGE